MELDTLLTIYECKCLTSSHVHILAIDIFTLNESHRPNPR